MSRNLKQIATGGAQGAAFAVILALASLVLAGCYSRIQPEPPQGRQGVLAVAGAPNTRDLGGLSGYDGRTVRWGYLVRSGQLDRITPGGRDFLFGSGGGRMGIETVVDFRGASLRLDFGAGDDLEIDGTSSERSRAPNRMPDGVLWTGDTGIPESAVFTALEDLIRKPDIEFDYVVYDLTQRYGNLVSHYRDQYLEFFQALLDANADGPVPVLFMCSTGKDRAGVAAALLLMALGVSEEDIIADYLLSKDLVYEMLFPVVPFLRDGMEREIREKRPAAQILVNTPDQAGPVLEALREVARRDVLRRHMQGVFYGITTGNPGMSTGDAIGEAGEVMARIVAGLDSDSTDPAVQTVRDAVEAAFGDLLDRMTEIGEIPGAYFDDWAANFATNAGNQIQPVLSVFPQWIGAVIEQVRYVGGIEEFLDDYDRFGMSGAAVVERLRDLYLEPGQRD